jgi:hypothetical protein
LLVFSLFELKKFAMPSSRLFWTANFSSSDFGVWLQEF